MERVSYTIKRVDYRNLENTKERLGAYNVWAEHTRKREDAARNCAYAELYDAAEAQGMRDTQAAWEGKRAIDGWLRSSGNLSVRIGSQYVSITIND